MSEENASPTYYKVIIIYISKIAKPIEGDCLKQDKLSLTHKNVTNFFVVYELHTRPHDLNANFKLNIVY